MIQNEYLIQALAEVTGINIRTIRYYQQEGLLPEPVNRGKFVYYTDEHIDRLKLIQELKNNYLPLKEIREQLNSLTPGQVKDLLNRQVPGSATRPSVGASPDKSPAQPGRDSALEYISRVLGAQDEQKISEPSPDSTATYRTVKSKRYGVPYPAESWHRIHIADGIELQVREPLSPDDQDRLEELIRLAQRLFY